MKKIIFFLGIIVVLSGCSFLGDVNDSLDYVGEATDHINELSNFAEDVPGLLQESANDPAVKEELKEKLNTLRDKIESFNAVEAPAIAKDIHKNLLQKNEVILDEINNVLQDGQLAIDKLENSQIIKTINEATDLINRLENLGL